MPNLIPNVLSVVVFYYIIKHASWKIPVNVFYRFRRNRTVIWNDYFYISTPITTVQYFLLFLLHVAQPFGGISHSRNICITNTSTFCANSKRSFLLVAFDSLFFISPVGVVVVISHLRVSFKISIVRPRTSQ